MEMFGIIVIGTIILVCALTFRRAEIYTGRNKRGVFINELDDEN